MELAEQKLQQSLRKAEALPVVEEELAVRLAALNQVNARLTQWVKIVGVYLSIISLASLCMPFSLYLYVENRKDIKIH